MTERKKIKITLPKFEEPKPFRCSVCGEMRERWQYYIEGKAKKLCNECAIALTPLNARLGWRHYEVFTARDAATYGDIKHLVTMLGAAG